VGHGSVYAAGSVRRDRHPHRVGGRIRRVDEPRGRAHRRVDGDPEADGGAPGGVGGRDRVGGAGGGGGGRARDDAGGRVEDEARRERGGHRVGRHRSATAAGGVCGDRDPHGVDGRVHRVREPGGGSDGDGDDEADRGAARRVGCRHRVSVTFVGVPEMTPVAASRRRPAGRGGDAE